MSLTKQELRMMNPPPQHTRSVHVYQPPSAIQSMKHISCGMLTLGVFLIVLSTGSIGLSAYMIVKVGTVDIVLVSLISGSFFFILGLLAIYGGSSVWNRKVTLILCGAIGIIGVIAALIICGILAQAINQEESNRKLCITCHTTLLRRHFDLSDISKLIRFGKEEMSGYCDFMCSLTPYWILGVLAILEGMFGLILSIVAFCNTCSWCCCYRGPPIMPTTVAL